VLAAVTPTLQLIQIFRAAAAIAVLLYHLTMTNKFYYAYLDNFFGWGHAGIDFFFQLSGFIMVYVNWDRAGHGEHTWRFLVQRLTRIYPIYWCVLLVTVAAYWGFPPSPENVWAPQSTLTPSKLLVAVTLQDTGATIIGPAWTLTYEVMFYLVFALFFVLPPRLFVALVLAWGAAILSQWQGIIAWPYPVALRLLVAHFLLGMAAAVLVRRWTRPAISPWWIAAAVVLWIAVARAEITGVLDAYQWYALPSVALLVSGGLYDHATRRTYPRPLVLLGEASYVIYLIHYGAIVLCSETVDAYRPLASWSPTLTLTVWAGIIVLAGVGIHQGLERPLLRTTRRMLGGIS